MNNRYTVLTRPLVWLGIALLLVAAALGAIEATRISLEKNYRETLANEVKRRALEVMAQTLYGNVMGAVAGMGLVNRPIKRVARGETPLQDAEVMETLQAVGKAYQANGVYVVNPKGLVLSCWYTMGVTLTGVDVSFRPYFQIAMQGKQNIYAAIGTTTGQRSLYFAAPLYGEASDSSPVIGITVARLDLERVDSVLKAWSGQALLLSPQQITFASNRAEWVERMGGEKTPEQLQAIRALKQFGKKFDKGTPDILPFDIGSETVRIGSQRYAVARAPVQWNDPNGEWTLVLLGNLDELMPFSRQAKIAAATSAAVLALSGLMLFWRRRLKRSEEQRRRAEAELNDYTRKLEFESSLKSNLAQISTKLQQTGSLAEFAREFMFHSMPLLETDYGVFYVLDEESQLLTPVGGHGVSAGELGNVAVGQGLVGQCAQDQQPIAIAPPSGSDIRVVWGGGEIMPKTIILQPIVQTGRLLGVLVLATLQPFRQDKQAVLEALAAMVAINLDILMRNLNTLRQAKTLQRQHSQLQKIEEIERFNQLAQGREQRIIDLKRQVNALAAKLGQAAVFEAPEMAERMEYTADSATGELAQANQPEILELGELVDLDKLQMLFTNFCESVGVAAAIIDLEGKVLAASRWQRACTDFHRVNPSACARCIESDTGLALQLKEGEEFTLYKCRNGMTDCASPIVVEGRHLANVFIGQFHVGQPDMVFFRNQAREFGFPQDDYLKAITEAPVLDEKKLPLILGFLTGFTNMVTSLSIERRRADVAQRMLQLRADELSKQRMAAISLAEDAESARADLLRLTAGQGQASEIS